jgi:dihydroorotate dehydrogenase
MPDWTYQTVFQPVLKRLPFPVAQNMVFRSMGLLGRTVVGRAVIRVMGHATPAAGVKVSSGNRTFPGPCGLGCGVDLSAQAVSATSLFGFGLIEVGPVSVRESAVMSSSSTEWREHGLSIPAVAEANSIRDLAVALQRNSFRNGVPVIARLVADDESTGDHLADACHRLDELVDGYSISLDPTSAAANVEQTVERFMQLRENSQLLFGVVSAECVANTDLADWVANLSLDGLIIEGGTDSSGSRGVLGLDVCSDLTAAVERVASGDRSWMLIASGGIEEPTDAMTVLAAGADMVLVDSGFAVGGPGIPKRINNNALAASLAASIDQTTSDNVPFGHRSWFWAFLLGLGLTVGGIAAVVLGWTRVLLPYDEEFLGMLRDEICGINPQLLPFMSHDRVTLAGTMLSLGPLYLALAWFGDRRGMHWARCAVLTSGFVGFLSFFLFLGFGYFDPFHAFIAAVMFQFITLCLRSTQANSQLVEFDLHNSAAWRRAMWGQLLMILHGVAILVAGFVISSFGVTTVFVPEDLEFMQTTQEVLVETNPRLIPLVAHDRATFGGMLLSTGFAVLLTSLWGWQRGRRWLWYSLTASGTVAYVTTIAIHWSVGYVSLKHLLPAYGGLACLWLAMMLSRTWMFEDASRQE